MSFRLTSPRIVMTERDVIHNCTAVLRQRGYWLKRNHVGRFVTPSGDWVTMGPPGIMDYIAVHETWPAFFVEFKRPGEVLRDTQQTEFQEIQFGYRLAAVMIDSVHELIDFLSGHESRARQRALQACPGPESL
jgi:hypothetical protein